MTSTYIRMSRTSNVRVDTLVETFDIRDARGRAVGYRCTITCELWEADETSYSSWNPAYAGRPIWRVHPHALRDGENYGASLERKVCFSEEEARAVASKMIAAYRKKMTKQFA